MAALSSSQAEIAQLRERGFVVLPAFLPDAALGALNAIARAQLDERSEPLELEADLNYPGAPRSRAAAGGDTVRRLLDAYGRDRQFAACATAVRSRAWLAEYFGERVMLSRAHHNCLMTKHPLYGSETRWHRDMRYWSFEREDLVSVWLALGEERIDNGALWFVPESHRRSFGADRFDEAKFFRADDGDNLQILRTAESPPLGAGDAVFFHCNTLHSAGQNLSNAVKFSLVFTYHAKSNSPRPGTRSASMPEVELER